MFIKGKEYFIETSGITFVPSLREGEENQGRLRILDDIGDSFTSYQVSKDTAKQVVSEISRQIMTTPTSKNCVIDIDKVIENVRRTMLIKGELNDRKNI